MLALELGVVACLIVLNGFFAMAELALVSSRRPRLAAMAEKGSTGAGAALRLLDNQARFLSSVQIGITLIGVLAGAFGGATLAEDLADWLQTLGLRPGTAETVGVAVVVAAILDVAIRGGHVQPVAEQLLARGIPFVLASGYGDWSLPENLRDQLRLTKPFTPADLEQQVKLLCARRR